MPTFEPTPEQRMLMEAAGRLAEQELRPAGADAEEAGEVPRSVIDKGWGLGLLAASLPQEFGGLGERSALTSALAAEELGRGDLSGALAILAPSAFALPILGAGTADQRRDYLPRFTGESWPLLFAAAVEPAFDFDPAAPATTAARVGDGYRLRGEKAWVPYADRAEALLVLAWEQDRVQAFLVPAGAEGVVVRGRERLLGLGALPLFRVGLEDVSLGAECRLGGAAGADVEPILAAARVATAALAVGLARAAYEYALRYAKDRHAFGAPIAQKQAVAFMLAEMATEIEAIRLLVWEAAWLLDRGDPAGRAAHLAHLGASDMAMMVTDRAVQVLGGHGYIRDHPVERWLREARAVASLCGLAMV
ncbi:MAG: acyl-CoA dehydrogenase family protein [Anaerolineales bacterium]